MHYRSKLPCGSSARAVVAAALMLGACSSGSPSAHTAHASASEPTPRCAAGTLPVMAMRHDPASACARPREVVGCMPADEACEDAITYALDPSGGGWWFDDTCVPSGWKATAYPPGTDGPSECS